MSFFKADRLKFGCKLSQTANFTRSFCQMTTHQSFLVIEIELNEIGRRIR